MIEPIQVQSLLEQIATAGTVTIVGIFRTEVSQVRNMHHFGSAGVVPMAQHVPQHQSRFDFSRLGNTRFRSANSMDIRGRMPFEFEQHHAGPPFSAPMQPRLHRPFHPWEREHNGAGPTGLPRFNAGPGRPEFIHHGRYQGPANFRPPQRFTPYPRPQMIRRNRDEIIHDSYEHNIPQQNRVWEQNFNGPNYSSVDPRFQSFAAPYESGPSGVTMPDWRLKYNNYYSTTQENHSQNIPVFRDVEKYDPSFSSPAKSFVGSEAACERERQRRVCEWVTRQANEAEFQRQTCSQENHSDYNDDEVVEEYDPVSPLRDRDSAGSEFQQGLSSSSENEESGNHSSLENGHGENTLFGFNNKTYTYSKAQQRELDGQTSEELAKAIKLFLARHVNSINQRSLPVAEVRDNFYYVGDFLQVSIYGNCKPKCTGGVYTSIASFGICFKKGNHLNCAGRLKSEYPQTPFAAELLAAERAILIAKHKIRANAVKIITKSTFILDNVEHWKQQMNSSEAGDFTPETWIEVKHVNEIRRLCKELDGINVEWTLGDTGDMVFKELQIAKNLSMQCNDIIKDFTEVEVEVEVVQ